MLVKKIARQLPDLDREVKNAGKLITSRSRDHPQAGIIESLPGMGPILGAQFLVATDGQPVFYMMAPSSLRAEGPSKAIYQRKRDENKLHSQDLLALARRLADVLWALPRDNRVYSPLPPSRVATAA